MSYCAKRGRTSGRGRSETGPYERTKGIKAGDCLGELGAGGCGSECSVPVRQAQAGRQAQGWDIANGSRGLGTHAPRRRRRCLARPCPWVPTRGTPTVNGGIGELRQPQDGLTANGKGGLRAGMPGGWGRKRAVREPPLRETSWIATNGGQLGIGWLRGRRAGLRRRPYARKAVWSPRTDSAGGGRRAGSASTRKGRGSPRTDLGPVGGFGTGRSAGSGSARP